MHETHLKKAPAGKRTKCTSQTEARTILGNITRSLKDKKEQLHKAKIMAINGGSLVPMQRLKYEINGL